MSCCGREGIRRAKKDDNSSSMPRTSSSWRGRPGQRRLGGFNRGLSRAPRKGPSPNAPAIKLKSRRYSTLKTRASSRCFVHN